MQNKEYLFKCELFGTFNESVKLYVDIEKKKILKFPTLRKEDIKSNGYKTIVITLNFLTLLLDDNYLPKFFQHRNFPGMRKSSFDKKNVQTYIPPSIENIKI